MEYVFVDIFFSLIGRFYLYITLRSKAKVKKVLEEQYDNSFTQAGSLLIWKTIALLLFFSLLIMLGAAFYGFLKYQV